MRRPYLKDRLIEEKDGYVVIVPVDAMQPVPLICPICVHVMRSRDDEHEYGLFGCCDRCSMLWARPNKLKWKEGWRPSTEDVEKANLERPPLTIVFDVDHT